MNKRGRVLVFLFLIILLSFSVFAIGIRATKVKETIDFSPNLKLERNYQISTNAGKPMDYLVYTEGELANYSSVEPRMFYNINSGATPTFHATLQLPASDYEIGPGLHDARFCAAETQTLGDGEGQIGIKTASCAVIWVRTLYNEKWIEFTFNAPHVNHGETAHFIIKVKSWTKQDISLVNAKITIKNKETNEILKILTTNSGLLPSNEEITLESYLETLEFLPGKYSAEIEIYYDELKKSSDSDFVIGTLDVSLLNYTKELESNKIDKFYVTLENQWNNKIENVHVELNIDSEISKSESFSLNARDKKEIMMYVDTNPFKLEEKQGILTIYYDGEKKSQDINLIIIKSKKKGIELSLLNIILMIVITVLVVVFILAAVFFIIKNKHILTKKKKKPKKNIPVEDDDW